MLDRLLWASNLLRPLQPTVLYVLSMLTAIMALHFKSPVRLFFVLPSIFFTTGSLFIIRNDPDAWIPPAFSFCQGLAAFHQLLWLPVLLVSADYSFNGITASFGQIPSILCTSFTFQSVAHAYRQWNNPRQLALYQGVPRSRRMTSATIVRFTCRRCLKILALHLINVLIAQPVFDLVMSRAMLVDFSPQSEPLIRRILFRSPTSTLDWEQLAVRALISWHWIWHDYQTLETFHAALAILCVAILGLDDVDEWPALYGNLLDACSVKRFWGRYWHRIMTRLYSWYARIFSRVVCRARPGTFIEKLVIAFGIFAISGLGHALVNWRNNEVALARDLLFFTANFGAVAAEVCIWRVARITLSKSRYKSLEESWQITMLGYIWVSCWFLWIVPRWEFPRMYDGWLKRAAIEFSRLGLI